MTSAAVRAMPSLIVTILMTTSYTTFAELVTSMVKLQQLPFLEERLLARVKDYTQGLMPFHIQSHNILSKYNSFFLARQKQVELLKNSTSTAWHPNDVYHLLKACSTQWPSVLQELPDLAEKTADLPSLPSSSEADAACLALVRLQLVYGIPVENMYKGNYLGFLGLPLTSDDAFEIGRQAFMKAYQDEAIPWLQKAASGVREDVYRRGTTPDSLYKLGQILGLLGRTYNVMKKRSRAEEIYQTTEQIDRTAPDFVQLGIDLDTDREYNDKPPVRDYQQELSELCSRRKDHRVDRLQPFHFCRYHSGLFVPYYRFKEEILSTSPFVSILYEVISDHDIEALKNIATERLEDGLITDAPKNERRDYDIRTSKHDWVRDTDIPEARKLSSRVQAITGLELCEPYCSEPFQVVNYGLGGHYHAHLDTFIEDIYYTKEHLKPSGNRLATFLFYMSDVDIGGATVFLKAGISVAPIKGSALFWYNMNPNMTVNDLTYHAGCPVVKGYKWIANKWIWSFENTLRRPCGPHPNSNQLEMEDLLFRHR